MYFEILKSFSQCYYVIKVCIGTLLGRTHSMSTSKPGGWVISMLLTRGKSFVNLSEELLNEMSVFVSFICSEILQSVPIYI